MTYEEKPLHEHLAAVQKLIADQQKAQRERTAAEAARRARLTPEQRLAEDRATAERKLATERQKAHAKLTKLGEWIRKADSWTISDFCWLLLAEKPGREDGFGFFDGRSTKVTKQHDQFREILASCVNTQLSPVNARAAPDQQRFRTPDLLRVARAKAIGHFDVLANIVGYQFAPRETSCGTEVDVPAPNQAGGSDLSRETMTMLRRRQLLELARSLAAEGKGSEHKTHIVLCMSGIELNELFRSAYPEWRTTANKTLQSDRLAGPVRIKVKNGRPRNAAEGHKQLDRRDDA